MSKRGIVHVCTSSLAALQEPSFLIEHDGKFYLTLAVLEFDPHHESVPRDEKRSIILKEMSNLFAGGARIMSLPLPPGQGISYANTFANTEPSGDQLGSGGGGDEDPNN